MSLSVFDPAEHGSVYVGVGHEPEVLHIYAQVAYSIAAYANTLGERFDLVLGGSCNVRVEGSNAVQIVSATGVDIVSKPGDATYLRTEFDQNAATSRITAGAFDLHLDFADSLRFADTARLDVSSATADALHTSKSNLDVVASNVNVVGAMTVSRSLVVNDVLVARGNFVSESNFLCRQSLFSSNVNIYGAALQPGSNPTDCVAVGFGLRMTPQNQLEIVKTAQFVDSNIVTQRIAVFGATGEPQYSASAPDTTLYMAFDELKGFGIGGSGSGSNGDGDGIVYNRGESVVYGGAMRGDLDFGGTYSLSNANRVSACNVTADVYYTAGADYAELFLAELEAEPVAELVAETIVGLTRLGRVTARFSESVRFMVVSGQPGIVGGHPCAPEAPPCGSVALAFCGRVPLSADVYEARAPEPGDYVVPVRRETDDAIRARFVRVDDLTLREYCVAVGYVLTVGQTSGCAIVVKSG
ncbi:hypothetical protein FOA52_004180 [Chlamydomonas sp. UWO 241]|nr:hypothetical protein FOA52_004180 [Chlamydomonas sp. UWO 241]